MMGHATIAMTMRYAHLSPSVVRDAVTLLDAQNIGHKLGTSRGVKIQSAEIKGKK
jgi:hypothetical protein